MAPGSNIGDGTAYSKQRTHCSKYADKDSSIRFGMLSGAMMFEFLGWKEAGKLIEDASRGRFSRSA